MMLDVHIAVTQWH